MIKRLICDTDKCDGCGICALVCSIFKENTWHPALARIKIAGDLPAGAAAYSCVHCENPPCMQACLMNVIYKDPTDGLTKRLPDHCIGCRACEISCPFGGATFNYIDDTVANCDLCSGSPGCVDYCPNQALHYLPEDEITARIRAEAARVKIAASMPGATIYPPGLKGVKR